MKLIEFTDTRGDGILYVLAEVDAEHPTVGVTDERVPIEGSAARQRVITVVLPSGWRERADFTGAVSEHVLRGILNEYRPELLDWSRLTAHGDPIPYVRGPLGLARANTVMFGAARYSPPSDQK